MKYILLTQDERVLVDENVYHWLSDYDWCVARRKSGRPYAVRRFRRGFRKYTLMWLHRTVAGYPSYFRVAFRDGNSLNCCRENLQILNLSGIEEYFRLSAGESNFIGVRWNLRAGAWEAVIADLSIGTFAAETDAARAYNAKALQIYGDKAALNRIPFLAPSQANRFPEDEGHAGFKTSEHRGVFSDVNGKFHVELYTGKRGPARLGPFDSEEEAKDAYNAMALDRGLIDRVNV